VNSGPFTANIAAGGNEARSHRVVLATLPEHWRIGATDIAVAMLAAGRAEQINTAMAAGRTAIVLADPTRLGPEEIERVVATARGKITVTVPLELAPRLATDALTSGTDATSWSIFDSVGQVERPDDLHHVLFEQLSAARLLLGGLERPSVLQRSNRHYVVSARGPQGTALTLTASVISNHRRHISVDLVATTQRFDIDLDLRVMATPIRLTRYDANGAVASWPVHQSGHRLVWADLATAIANRSEPAWTLRRTQEDLRLVRHLLGQRSDSER
jgi:hypothetical protein